MSMKPPPTQVELVVSRPHWLVLALLAAAIGFACYMSARSDDALARLREPTAEARQGR